MAKILKDFVRENKKDYGDFYKVKAYTISGKEVIGIKCLKLNLHSLNYHNDEIDCDIVVLTKDEEVHQMHCSESRTVQLSKEERDAYEEIAKARKVLDRKVLSMLVKAKASLDEFTKEYKSVEKINRKALREKELNKKIENDKALKKAGFLTKEEIELSMNSFVKNTRMMRNFKRESLFRNGLNYDLESTGDGLSFKVRFEEGLDKYLRIDNYPFIYEEYDGQYFIEQEWDSYKEFLEKRNNIYFDKMDKAKKTISIKELGVVVKIDTEIYVGDKRTLFHHVDMSIEFNKNISKKNLNKVLELLSSRIK